mmetsp:Transcript_35723/g.69380  ORF Transcript_35723/g.69380 Transcript_35723/m.69380 type:complete len:284 (+) Transcript_35723:175-1026(+)
MFDPMLFSPSVGGQFSLGPSTANFNSSAAEGSQALFTPGDDTMRLSGPPATSDTITMSAHRSLFSEGGGGGGSGLKRSMSSAVLDEMESSNFDYYSIKSPDRIGDVKKGVSPGGSDSGAPQPLGLRSSSSCPNLQQLKAEEDDTAGSQHDTTDKIKKRKARKAEVARQCRKRKKAYIQSLEEKAKALAEQLSALSNKRHKGGGNNMDVETQRKAEQQKILDKMQRLVNKSNLDDSNRELKSLVTGFSNNSRKRQRACASQVSISLSLYLGYPFIRSPSKSETP